MKIVIGGIGIVLALAAVADARHHHRRGAGAGNYDACAPAMASCAGSVAVERIPPPAVAVKAPVVAAPMAVGCAGSSGCAGSMRSSGCNGAQSERRGLFNGRFRGRGCGG